MYLKNERLVLEFKKILHGNEYSFDKIIFKNDSAYLTLIDNSVASVTGFYNIRLEYKTNLIPKVIIVNGQKVGDLSFNKNE